MTSKDEVQWLNRYQCGTRSSEQKWFSFYVNAEDFTEASKSATRIVGNYNVVHNTDYAIYELIEVSF